MIDFILRVIISTFIFVLGGKNRRRKKGGSYSEKAGGADRVKPFYNPRSKPAAVPKAVYPVKKAARKSGENFGYDRKFAFDKYSRRKARNMRFSHIYDGHEPWDDCLPKEKDPWDKDFYAG